MDVAVQTAPGLDLSDQVEVEPPRSSGFNDKWLDLLRECNYLELQDLKSLCDIIREILITESNVIEINAPVTVCGDVHGQFYDVMELFRIGRDPPETSYIFMGDFVDRGYFSLETFSLLLALKAKYPQKITLLRGNHESRQITQVYGFYDECMQKYSDVSAWKYCTQVFDMLNTAAVINGKIFCVHGGLSPDVQEVDAIRLLDRNCEVPINGALCDLLWSDPEDIEFWQPSPRGGGYLFGAKATKNFLWANGLDLVSRAHQLIQEGYQYMFDEQLVTVWSAPNYCYRCGNVASIMNVDENLKVSFQKFEAVPEDKRQVPKTAQQSRYFI
jgi:diadenosine tetraphosphatase ApaH/serine/threonine PP2A family protein phosphatase